MPASAELAKQADRLLKTYDSASRGRDGEVCMLQEARGAVEFEVMV